MINTQVMCLLLCAVGGNRMRYRQRDEVLLARSWRRSSAPIAYALDILVQVSQTLHVQF